MCWDAPDDTGDVKCNWDCILFWPVSPISKLMAVFEVCEKQPLKTLHNNQYESNWAVITETGDRWPFGYWNDGCGFEACGVYSLLLRKIKDVSIPANWSALDFSVRPGTLSGPAAFHVLIFFRVILTWWGCRMGAGSYLGGSADWAPPFLWSKCAENLSRASGSESMWLISRAHFLWSVMVFIRLHFSWGLLFLKWLLMCWFVSLLRLFNALFQLSALV